MSGMYAGAVAGAVLGLAGFLAMRTLAGRVELPETKRVLTVVSIVDLALFPVLGAFAGGLISGD